MMANVVVAKDRKDVDPKVWTPAHVALIKAAAEDQRVNRLFVNTPTWCALSNHTPKLTQSHHQEGALPRRRPRSRLAAQGATVVGARLAFPCPPRLPARQPGMRAAAAARGGGRLQRRRDASLVHGGAARRTIEAATGTQNARAAGGLLASAQRAVARLHLNEPESLFHQPHQPDDAKEAGPGSIVGDSSAPRRRRQAGVAVRASAPATASRLARTLWKAMNCGRADK